MSPPCFILFQSVTASWQFCQISFVTPVYCPFSCYFPVSMFPVSLVLLVSTDGFRSLTKYRIRPFSRSLDYCLVFIRRLYSIICF